MMKTVLIVSAALLLVSCKGFQRDIPDETKVQSFPAWNPAPNNKLPPLR